METITKYERNLAALIHATTFTKYFIPLGNFLLPLILWLANRKRYAFVNRNGKKALNFQISLLVYSLLLAIFCLPFLIGIIPQILHHIDFDFLTLNSLESLSFNFDYPRLKLGRYLWPLGIAAAIQAGLFIINIVYTILATIRTSEGQDFKYPLSITFIK